MATVIFINRDFLELNWELYSSSAWRLWTC